MDDKVDSVVYLPVFCIIWRSMLLDFLCAVMGIVVYCNIMLLSNWDSAFKGCHF